MKKHRIILFAFALLGLNAINETNAQTSIKQGLDSVVTFNGTQGKTSVFTYDSRGNTVLIINYKRDYSSQGDFVVLDTKTENTYNNQSKLTMSITYHWYYNDWIEVEKNEWTYDNQGKLTVEISNKCYWIPTGDSATIHLCDKSKTEYTYESGHMKFSKYAQADKNLVFTDQTSLFSEVWSVKIVNLNYPYIIPISALSIYSSNNQSIIFIFCIPL